MYAIEKTMTTYRESTELQWMVGEDEVDQNINEYDQSGHEDVEPEGKRYR